jgi:small subunit ribosomal protein S9
MEEDMKSYLGVFERIEETMNPDQAKQETSEDPYTRLSLEQQTQIEIYKRIDKEPFYRHYLVNELTLFSEKFSEMYEGMQQKQLPHFIMRNQNKLKLPNEDDKDSEGPVMNSLDNSPRHKIFNRKLYDGKAFGSGKRKTSSALAMIQAGTGKFEVNYMPLPEYFEPMLYRGMVLRAAALTNYLCSVDVKVYVHGSGMASQAAAAGLAVAKALCRYDPSTVPLMRKFYLLATDARMVERKKVGKYKARKKFPFVRR